MKRVAFYLLAAVVAGATGCTEARFVQKDKDSGIVAIPENTNQWPTHYREAAEAMIKNHVGPNFVILEEREVVTGGRAEAANPASPTSNTGPGSKEYRITYARRPIQPGAPIYQGPVGARPMGMPGQMGPGVITTGGMQQPPPPPNAYAPGGLTSPSSTSIPGMVPSVSPGNYPYTASGSSVSGSPLSSR